MRGPDSTDSTAATPWTRDTAPTIPNCVTSVDQSQVSGSSHACRAVTTPARTISGSTDAAARTVSATGTSVTVGGTT